METLSEAYKEHTLHLRHIIPLDFSSLPSLPDSHAWSLSNDDYNNNTFPFNDDDDASSSSIPMIDLMDPNAMHLIGHACETWGAFQLKNHGIPFGLIEGVEQEAKNLFSLPTQQKLKALRSPGAATGYGRAQISPFFPSFMWHEGFTIIGSPSHHAKKIWPTDFQHFCDLIEKYEKQMKILAERLTKMALELLEISEEKRKWVGGNNISGAVQLNFYPSCPEPKRAMGLAPHTDTSLFTILHQTQTTGLQIFKEGKGWVPVHPNPNTLVVNTGDLLHIMSNARFRCALHRVTVNRSRKRYSVAYFYSPPIDYVLSPLNVHSAARFRAVTVKEYFSIKAKKFGEALSLIST
ncbi:hypothetical protein Fmac_000800 [Flemingia macrophylla]|uniref:gibberellin 3beta-dioxygenase n=1 Tax=Flemingia macrophylla TaxID=520843 RepID=A0ABD1NFA6_9FABA